MATIQAYHTDGLFEQALPDDVIDTIIHASAVDMRAIPDRSTHLVVTSPPYNAGIDYDCHQDARPMDEYLAELAQVWRECYRALVYGARICVVSANTGRKPYLPLTHRISDALQDAGFDLRGEIIWNKGASGITSAWGSWRTPGSPVLRDQHEYIITASKGLGAYPNAHGRAATISAEDFLAATRSVWTIAPASAKRIGHPTPFPVEIPRRLIELFTFAGDVVLDPFIGSGTTALAAAQTGRRYIGYEISADYIKTATARLDGAAAHSRASARDLARKAV